MTELEFTEKNGWYEASFEADGDTHVVQIKRDVAGVLQVKESIGELEPEVIFNVSGISVGENILFKIGEPSGAIITIVSKTPVTKGGYE